MVLFFSQKAMKLPPRVCQSPQILWIFENMAERRVSHTHSAKYILPNTKNTFLLVFLTSKFFENIMRKVSFLEMSQKIIPIKGSVNVREVGGFSFPRVAPCDINGASLQELSRTGETGLNFLYSAASQLQMCLLKGVHLAWPGNHEVASTLQYILRVSLCTLPFVFLTCFDKYFLPVFDKYFLFCINIFRRRKSRGSILPLSTCAFLAKHREAQFLL